MRLQKWCLKLATTTVGFGLLAGTAAAQDLTIATANNGDMIIMQKLSPKWE